MTCPTCSGRAHVAGIACLRCYGGGDLDTRPADGQIIAACLGMRAEALRSLDQRARSGLLAMILRAAQIGRAGRRGTVEEVIRA